MTKKIILGTIIIAVILSMLTFTAFSTEQKVSAQADFIPSWVKTNAGWWAEGVIGDGEFVGAIEYLIDENIIQISSVQTAQAQTGGPSSEGSSINTYMVLEEFELIGFTSLDINVGCDSGDALSGGGFKQNTFGDDSIIAKSAPNDEDPSKWEIIVIKHIVLLAKLEYIN